MVRWHMCHKQYLSGSLFLWQNKLIALLYFVCFSYSRVFPRFVTVSRTHAKYVLSSNFHSFTFEFSFHAFPHCCEIVFWKEVESRSRVSPRVVTSSKFKLQWIDIFSSSLETLLSVHENITSRTSSSVISLISIAKKNSNRLFELEGFLLHCCPCCCFLPCRMPHPQFSPRPAPTPSLDAGRSCLQSAWDCSRWFQIFAFVNVLDVCVVGVQEKLRRALFSTKRVVSSRLARVGEPHFPNKLYMDRCKHRCLPASQGDFRNARNMRGPWCHLEFEGPHFPQFGKSNRHRSGWSFWLRNCSDTSLTLTQLHITRLQVVALTDTCTQYLRTHFVSPTCLRSCLKPLLFFWRWWRKQRQRSSARGSLNIGSFKVVLHAHLTTQQAQIHFCILFSIFTFSWGESVAVCFIGRLRALETTLNSLQEHFLKALLEGGNSVDMFGGAVVSDGGVRLHVVVLSSVESSTDEPQHQTQNIGSRIRAHRQHFKPTPPFVESVPSRPEISIRCRSATDWFTSLHTTRSERFKLEAKRGADHRQTCANQVVQLIWGSADHFLGQGPVQERGAWIPRWFGLVIQMVRHYAHLFDLSDDPREEDAELWQSTASLARWSY